ncbi:MAG: pyridoxamine 5'-phosphate oxidase [Bdellovibrionales bacterium]|nr:pyridoxamine 5'-phosphate oxidase [Bdellovibrionales bacterium]
MKRLFSTSRELFFLFSHPSLWFRKPLRQEQLKRDPFEQFADWYRAAERQIFVEFVNWLCLSTIDENGYPDGRIVLLKEFDPAGFVFYTNTLSRKGRALERNPKASMTFYWGGTQRQVRILGDVEKVEEKTADAYFASRPRESQLGAWASQQSAVLSSREQLAESVEKYREKFSGHEVPRPPFWTGYRLIPRRFEFWELRLSRLHDRFEYFESESGSWEIRRLSP